MINTWYLFEVSVEDQRRVSTDTSDAVPNKGDSEEGTGPWWGEVTLPAAEMRELGQLPPAAETKNWVLTNHSDSRDKNSLLDLRTLEVNLSTFITVSRTEDR